VFGEESVADKAVKGAFIDGENRSFCTAVTGLYASGF